MAATAAVDLALVLAVDCSSSADFADYQLQMRGIAAALRHPLLVDAVRSGPNQVIALTLVHWSTRLSHVVVVPWEIVGNAAGLERVAARIEQVPRQWLPGGTGLAAAMEFCTELLLNLPFRASRLIIDVSGDGGDNDGGSPALARDHAIANGITINGLPIVNGSQLLLPYYRQHVVGGKGSFLTPAKDIGSFPIVILRKLLREITTAVA